jgi:dihydroorotase
MNQVADLVIDEGKITQLGKGIPIVIVSEAKQPLVIDATGWAVCPGFIDLHCHLREPGFEEKETIATGTKAAAAGGFVAVCCMANTNPPIDNRAMVEWVKQKASREGVVHVFPIGCVTRDRKGEELCDMAELAEAGVVAFSDDGAPVVSSQVMHRALEYSCALGLPIVDHCEDRRLSNGGVVNEGWMSTKFGLRGIPASAEEMMVARDLALAKLANARIHIAHVSTCGSVELIRRAKEEGILVTAEVTPHHLTLTEERIMGKDWGESNNVIASEAKQSQYDTNAKVNPPLRTEDDITCLIEGLKNGVLDAIATDHAPHTLADKDCNLEMAAFGISGFETAFGALMGLVHKGEIGLVTLISKLTCEPARIVGKGGELGMLKVGSPANITIFDPDREWVVDSSKFASKGKNTPFDGCKFKGKVMATIVDGEIVYMDDSLKSHCHPPSVIASEAKQTGSLKIRRIFRVKSHG